MGIILVILATFLLILLLPVGLTMNVILLLTFKRKWYKQLNDSCMKIAISIDQLGNVVFQYPMNYLFISKSSIDRFGNEDETISSVLGKNERSGNLKYLGKVLGGVLNWIDPGHLEKSIDD